MIVNQKQINAPVVKNVFLLALYSILIFPTLSSTLFAERLPVKTYTVADGLQRNEASRIRRDSRGFLWFCTAEGISRFDGTNIMNFTVADGLPDRFVEDFLETAAGTIYIATGKGLARLNPHGLRNSAENPLFTIIHPDNPKAEKILTLFEDKSGQVWVGTFDGLYKLNESENRLEAVPMGEPLRIGNEPNAHTLYVTAILEDRRGALWVGTEGNGLFRLDKGGDVRQYTTADRLGDNKIADLLETRDGRLWASMRGGAFGGLCILDAEDAGNPVRKCFTEKDGLPTTWIPDLLETSEGQLWLATVSGLCRWQGEGGASVCKTYTEKNGLCDGVGALAEDTDGNLWTGSSCGTKKIARYGFTAYYAADGLDWNKPNSIFENSQGELFVSTNRNGRAVSRFDGEKFSPVKPKVPEYAEYAGWGWQQTVWQDSRGAWWIPNGWGLFRSPDATDFENLERAPLRRMETGAESAPNEANRQIIRKKYGEKLASSVHITEIFRLFEDSRGDIWITTTGYKNQLRRWERGADVWHDYTAPAGFSTFRIGSALAEDANGNIWIGASSDIGDGALLRYRPGGEFQVMLAGGDAPSGWIRDLFVDSRGRLWIASTSSGLWRTDEPNAAQPVFVKYTTADGLTSNSTACVTEDEYGRIYVGTWRGIDRLTLDNGQVEHFTTADGLSSSFVDSGYRDRQNNLWFATEQGLSRFQPEPLRHRAPPNILITGLRVGGEAQSVSILGEKRIAPLDLDSDKRQITVDFQGLGASLGEKINYEYRFGDAEWIQTAERTLNFANLAAGEYIFEVRAQTADRIYSQPASVSFRIAAPLWQRWWFLLSAVALVAFVIYLLYKNRLRRLLELEKVRTRIATDLHDDIGANLTRISLLSEVAKQKAENGNGQLLSSIADIARESVTSMNDIVWAIAPEHDSLLDLTRRLRSFAEEVFALRDIDLDFNAPSSETDLKLSVGVRRDLLLIFKEAVNNAAKHSGCTKVSIDFTLENSALNLCIKDNGKGFDRDAPTDGQGLRSLARRAAALGGTLEIESRGGAGTTVNFEMSLQKAF